MSDLLAPLDHRIVDAPHLEHIAHERAVVVGGDLGGAAAPAAAVAVALGGLREDFVGKGSTPAIQHRLNHMEGVNPWPYQYNQWINDLPSACAV